MQKRWTGNLTQADTSQALNDKLKQKNWEQINRNYNLVNVIVDRLEANNMQQYRIKSLKLPLTKPTDAGRPKRQQTKPNSKHFHRRHLGAVWSAVLPPNGTPSWCKTPLQPACGRVRWLRLSVCNHSQTPQPRCRLSLDRCSKRSHPPRLNQHCRCCYWLLFSLLFISWKSTHPLDGIASGELSLVTPHPTVRLLLHIQAARSSQGFRKYWVRSFSKHSNLKKYTSKCSYTKIKYYWQSSLNSKKKHLKLLYIHHQ